MQICSMRLFICTNRSFTLKIPITSTNGFGISPRAFVASLRDRGLRVVEFRPVSLDQDRPFILDMFVMREYESASDADRRPGLNKYREDWLSSPKAEAYLAAVEASLDEPSTIAEIVAVNGTPAGFVWATMEGLPYEERYFELRLVALKLNFQRQGIGRVSTHHLEELAAERGAASIHSTGNAASEGIRRFHASVGFQPIQTVYEKKLAARTQ